jgi:EAL domain-containing protein (putative c-di-GMP-specific phosphodiesterase class I)
MSIDDLLSSQNLFHHYQPIYDFENDLVLGYEALIRSSESDYSNPDEIFTLAQKEKQLYELDSRSIHKAVQTYSYNGYSSEDGKLFLNVLPSTLLNSNFLTLIKNMTTDGLLNSQHIVFEITEQEITNFERVNAVLNSLKKYGMSIAIDDFGNGFLDMKKLIDLEPNYIKLDRYFSEELSVSPRKQDAIKFLLEYCQKFNIDLILEGLETIENIDVSKDIGIPFGQGFGLGKPSVLVPKDILKGNK